MLGRPTIFRATKWGLLWAWTQPLLSLAAPPDVTAIFPAGASRGSEIRVKLQGKVNAEEVQIWTSTPGIESIGADGKDAVKIKIAPDASLGVSWISWHNADGISSQRPFVVGALPEIAEVEPNNAIVATAPVVTLPVVANGVLEKSGDVDTYPVSLKAGETLVAALDALKSLGSPMDGLVQVADTRGFVLVQNDDARGFDPQLSFTATRDDLYYVRVFAFPAAPDSSIRFSGAATYVYRLTLTTSSVVTRWSPAAVTAGAACTIRGRGRNTPADGMSIELAPRNAGFAAVPQPEFLALCAVQVVPHPVVTATADNSRSVPQAVAIPVCVAGELVANRAEHAWKFTATKGQKLSLQVATEAIGSPMDAVVRIFDAGGKRLQEYDDVKRDDFEIDTEFTVPVDGEYTVAVSERFWHGGPEYVYTLTIEPSSADFALTVPQNALVLKAGDKLEIPVTIDRRRGMSAPIQISATELPDGVTAEPVTSEPKGDSSKSVKIVLQSTRDTAWLGALQVVGKSDGDPILERHAVVAPISRQIVPPQVLLKVLGKTP